MKSKFIIVFLLACAVSFSSFLPSDVSIEIPKDFSGWVVIVGSSKEPVKSRIILDSKGVGYIDSTTLNDEVHFQYYQNANKLTAHELKFFYTASVVPKEYYDLPTTDKEFIAHKRKIYSFYVLSKEELAKGDEYWDNEKNQKPLENKSRMHVDEWIRKGWMKVE